MTLLSKKLLPTDWQQVKLGDISTITNGKTNSQDAVINGKYPLFDRSIAIKKSNKYLFDNTAIILPGEGAEFIPRYYSGKFDLHQRAYAIFPKNFVDPKFLFQYLNGHRSVFAKNAVGSTVKSLRLPIIQSVGVLLPPLSAQKKIAEILGTVDDEIQKTDEIIEATEKLKKGLVKKLFTRGIGHTKFKKTKIGDIPSGWELVSLEKIFKMTSGKPLSKRQFVSGDFMVYGGNGTSGTHNEFFLENPTIIIGRVGEYCGVVHITTPQSWVTDNALYIERFYQNINELFLFYFLVWSNLNQYAKVGGQPSISQNTIGDILVGLPEPDEQKKIAEIISSVDKKIFINQSLKTKLTLLKKGLMQDLLGGKVRIQN